MLNKNLTTDAIFMVYSCKGQDGVEIKSRLSIQDQNNFIHVIDFLILALPMIHLVPQADR